MANPDLLPPEEVMPSLFANIGMIVLNWNFAENNLDAWTALAYGGCGGSAIEKEIPRQFGRKVAFLRKAFNRLDPLKPFAAEALPYVERAKVLSDVRHYVAHGVLQGFDAADNETFIFQKLDISAEKTAHILGELRIPGEHLIRAANELLLMAAYGQKLTLRIVKALEAQDGDDEFLSRFRRK